VFEPRKENRQQNGTLTPHEFLFFLFSSFSFFSSSKAPRLGRETKKPNKFLCFLRSLNSLERSDGYCECDYVGITDYFKP